MAGFLSWEHLQTVVRVQSEKRDNTTDAVLESEDRYFLSSLAQEALTDEQWLRVVRNHWWVENGCHQIWDKIFREDDKPWIQAGEGSSQAAVGVQPARPFPGCDAAVRREAADAVEGPDTPGVQRADLCDRRGHRDAASKKGSGCQRRLTLPASAPSAGET